MASAKNFAHWVDPQTGQEFVLVPVEQFEWLRSIVDRTIKRADWDDPALDAYEEYRRTE